MAIEKVVNINIKDNANDVEKDINSLNQAGKKLDNTFKDVNATFEDVYGELKPLTARLGEAEDRLYELALAGKQNTQEYKELLQATANYRQVQIQTDLVVDSAAQTMSQKLGGALEGAASGFALVQGAMGLFGSESEEVEKALLKVQSAMALAQGIEGVRTALPMFSALGNVIKTNVVGAFKTLKGAIMATGIGALVVTLSIIIPKIIEWVDWTSKAKDEQEKLNKALFDQQVKLKESRKELEKDLDFREKYAKALGKSDDELLEIQKGNNEKRNEAIKKEIKAAQDRLEALRKVDLGVMASSKEEYLELKKNNYEKRVEIVKELKELKGEIEQNNQSILLAETELNTRKKDLRNDDKKNVKDTHKEIINSTEEFYKQLNVIESQRKSELILEIEKLENEYLDTKLTEQQREINAVEDKYFTLLNKAKEYNDSLTAIEQSKRIDTTILEEAQKNELANINAKYNVITTTQNEEASNKDVETTKLTLDQKYKMTYDTINALSGLNDLFNAKNEKDARAQFKINKALSLAQASIQTFQAVTGALTAGGNPIKLATGAQFIEAGIAAAVGGANIAKIAATQFGGFGDKSTPPSNVPTATIDSSIKQLSSPNFNVVGASGISQTENLQPVKAYVVSGDVTSAQALDRNRIQNATF